MRQFLHLMIVDAAHGAVPVTKYGDRWMLPILATPERVRPGPVVSHWIASRGFETELLGQWLGRAAPDGGAIDWLIVVLVKPRARPIVPASHWKTLDDLRASTSLMEYQGWASRQVRLSNGIPSVVGPFGDPSWFAQALAWIAAATESNHLPHCGDMVWHRFGAYEVVIEGRTADRRWFFKGLARDRAGEAIGTRAMAQLLPNSFAHTIALEDRPDGSVWWLMDACPGSELAMGFSTERATRVARAYAQVQQRIGGALVGACGTAMPRFDVDTLPGWTRSMFDRDLKEPLADVVVSAVETSCAAVGRACVPASWVALDLDPTNVLVDDDAVRFIDLDDAMFGPAPLGIATFVRRCTSRPRRDPAFGDVTSLLDAYSQAWNPCLTLTPREWRAMFLVSRAIEAQLAWQRVQMKTRRGEVYGCLGCAVVAIRRMLLEAVRAASGFGVT